MTDVDPPPCDTVRLWAISDLHLGSAENQAALRDLPAHPGDWLVLAGDVGERPEQLEGAFAWLAPRFARLVWVPGNHELWTRPGPAGPLRGAAKYAAMLEVCRRHGVLTPEDPYAVFGGERGPVLVVPLFLLYDYSFRPQTVDFDRVLDWAAEHRVRSADELLLSPDPWPSRQAWCAARVALTRARLDAELPPGMPTVLANHFPLRQDLVHLPRIPRFSPWCGTVATEDWHLRYRAVACVHGHLHIPGTLVRDGVPFHEVSLGYAKQWTARGRPPASYLRRVL